jgi:malonyl-CoA/methylmalonyl-CoA synthetase
MLVDASARVASALLGGEDDLREARIAFLIPGSFEYVAVQWGGWRAGGIAVPLSVGAKEPELEHVFADAEIRVALVTETFRDRLEGLAQRLGFELLLADEVLSTARDGTISLPTLGPARRAMMLYTSGTTSKPKGVVTTHANIEAQIKALVEAWGWRADDRIPLFLPLHHIHGIVNVLSCALWSGARVEAFESFDMDRILARVEEQAYTVFMAVPTIYVKLIRAFEEAGSEERERWAEGFRAMRLMISGSAALPAATHETWTRLTGQRLLERYGMTEIGMGLSNPLHGERRPGAVGQPLPGVELRLVSEGGEVIHAEGEPGEIQIRGPSVRPSPRGGSAREIWRFSRTATTASWDASRWISSSRAGTRSRPWRSRTRSGHTRRSAKWQWWAWRTRSGGRQWRLRWSPWKESISTWRASEPGPVIVSPPTRFPSDWPS